MDTTKIKSFFYKTKLTVKRNSPQILIVGGVIGVVTSTIMACRATTKLDSILEDTNKKIDKVHEYESSDSNVDSEGNIIEYTEDDAKHDLMIIHTQNVLKIAKLYAPSVIIGGLSLGMIIASNNILRKRNIALATAYATIDKSFKSYRKRVADRFGEEVEKEIRYNVKKIVTEEPVLDENGNPTGETETKVVEVSEYDGVSDYARYFDENTSRGYENDPLLNKMFLVSRENFANDQLHVRGYLFLNDVYELLGMEKTVAGQSVGWVIDKDSDISDNHVSFGLYDCGRQDVKDFMNGYRSTVLLDFNVDGPILERVKLKEI